MTVKQVGFDNLLNNIDSLNKKNVIDKSSRVIKKTNTRQTTTKRKSSLKKVSLTQDDMDKLCEIYDWYLLVKDLDILKSINISDKSNEIYLESDIIKETKRVNIGVDKYVWDDFNSLCSNIGQKKSDVLSQILKDFINNHKDLV